MIAILRYFLRAIKKEHLFLARYERSHPHFFWYVGLDAVLSVGLVVGGFQIVHNGYAWKTSHLESQFAGVKELSAGQAVDEAHREHLEVYWLGQIPGEKYSLEFEPGAESALTYLADGSRDLQDSNKPKLIIQTYNSYGTYAASLHPVLDTGGEGSVDNSNYTLHFDSNFMLTVTIVFKHSSRVVVIHYPANRSASSMIKDADALALM